MNKLSKYKLSEKMCKSSLSKKKEKKKQHRLMEQIIENTVAYTERMKI